MLNNQELINIIKKRFKINTSKHATTNFINNENKMQKTFIVNYMTRYLI